MFEKESQDYAARETAPRQELYIKGRADIDADYENVKRIWREGAEFGYNKANEWHYPSRGELPTCDEKTHLAFYVTCYYKDITRKRLVLGYYQKSFMNDDVMVFTEKSKGYEEEHLTKDVIAWKEIVPPKEIE